MSEAYDKTEAFHRRLRALQAIVGDGAIPVGDHYDNANLIIRANDVVAAGVAAFQSIVDDSNGKVNFSLGYDGEGGEGRQYYMQYSIGETLKIGIAHSKYALEEIEKHPKDAAVELAFAVHSVNLACEDLALALGVDFPTLSDRLASMATADSLGM